MHLTDHHSKMSTGGSREGMATYHLERTSARQDTYSARALDRCLHPRWWSARTMELKKAINSCDNPHRLHKATLIVWQIKTLRYVDKCSQRMPATANWALVVRLLMGPQGSLGMGAMGRVASRPAGHEIRCRNAGEGRAISCNFRGFTRTCTRRKCKRLHGVATRMQESRHGCKEPHRSEYPCQLANDTLLHTRTTYRKTVVLPTPQKVPCTILHSTCFCCHGGPVMCRDPQIDIDSLARFVDFQVLYAIVTTARNYQPSNWATVVDSGCRGQRSSVLQNLSETPRSTPIVSYFPNFTQRRVFGQRTSVVGNTENVCVLVVGGTLLQEAEHGGSLPIFSRGKCGNDVFFIVWQMK